MDWGWGVGLHMPGWWLIAALGVLAVAALIYVLLKAS
jgi:hypothetical protein